MAINKKQADLYMQQRQKHKPQLKSAARADISERTARRIDNGQHTSQHPVKPRTYATRKDPLAAVWDSEIKPMLEKQPGLLPVTLFEYLQDKYPGEYDHCQRTLQRRIKQWRALEHDNNEIIFRQTQQPGEQAFVDFTIFKGLTILIAGVVLSFRLFHFRLAYCKWSYLSIVQGGESFTALAEGVTESLQRLGASPKELRTDSLSAAFRNLSTDDQADITERYQALCLHYHMKPTRNNRGVAHENGAVESAHGHLKRRIEQQLQLSFPAVTNKVYEFASIKAFQSLIDGVVRVHNRRNEALLREELVHMSPLPKQAGVSYTEEHVKVSSSSTINLRRVVYSVPAGLIGERLKIRLFDDRLECYLGSTHAITLKRLHPAGNKRARSIDYRHVIHSLARKPMAFYHAELRDDILPNESWRQLWQHCCRILAPRPASYLFVGALEIAAEHHQESDVLSALERLLAKQEEPSLLALQKELGMCIKAPAEMGNVGQEQHALTDYDALIRIQGAS